MAINTDMELDPSEQSREPTLDLADLDDAFSDSDAWACLFESNKLWLINYELELMEAQPSSSSKRSETPS